jgi:hypothetical protein
MHELGHALSIGWNDDAKIHAEAPFVGDVYVPFVAENAYEVYSGSEKPGLAGGVDSTPETVIIHNDPVATWSLMARGSGNNLQSEFSQKSNFPVFGFSLEELLTSDFDHIPSKSE